MRFLSDVCEILSRVPLWVPLLFALAPAAAAIACAALLRRGWYAPCAAASGGIAFALLAARGTLYALVFAGGYVAYAALCSPLCRLPFGRLRKRKQEKRDALYEKYKPEIPPPPPETLRCGAPLPVEDDMRLGYAEELVKKLVKCKLSPADRLETEAIARSFGRFRGKELGREEVRALNDVLSSVLKLTAKYKL